MERLLNLLNNDVSKAIGFAVLVLKMFRLSSREASAVLLATVQSPGIYCKLLWVLSIELIMLPPVQNYFIYYTSAILNQ